MIIVAVASLLLLLFAALCQSWWGRAPNQVWYGSAAYAWGMFLLALYITWPTIRPLF
jgi:hypothetical protein